MLKILFPTILFSASLFLNAAFAAPRKTPPGYKEVIYCLLGSSSGNKALSVISNGRADLIYEGPVPFNHIYNLQLYSPLKPIQHVSLLYYAKTDHRVQLSGPQANHYYTVYSDRLGSV